MKRPLTRLLSFGALTWIIPFIVSMPFFGADGKPKVDLFLFKSIMLLVGSITGGVLLVKWISSQGPNYPRAAMQAGISWLLINWLLDLLILVPMSPMDHSTWFGQIGVRYLVIPIAAYFMGNLADGVARKT